MGQTSDEERAWPSAHAEPHRLERQGWLRAAVMGANDGILSTASLVIGVASGGADAKAVALAGIAGAVAGSLSMAAGEYVAVSSQSDLEQSDIDQERRELAKNPKGELEELESIYRLRGLSPRLAAEVAAELTAKDALGAHLRDEVGLQEHTRAKPLLAAAVSAAAFSAGAAPPILVADLASGSVITPFVAVVSVTALAVLGAIGAQLGGAKRGRAAARVATLGVLAMGLSAAIGHLVGTVL